MRKKSPFNRREFFERIGFGNFFEKPDEMRTSQNPGVDIAQNVRQDTQEVMSAKAKIPELIITPQEIRKLAKDMSKEYSLSILSDTECRKKRVRGHIRADFWGIVYWPLRKIFRRRLKGVDIKPEQILQAYETHADRFIEMMIAELFTQARQSRCFKDTDLKMLYGMFAATGLNPIRGLKVGERALTEEDAVQMLESLSRKFEKFQFYIERLEKPPIEIKNKYSRYKKLDDRQTECFAPGKESEADKCWNSLNPDVEKAKEDYLQTLVAHLNEEDKWRVDAHLVEWIFKCNENYGPEFLKMVAKIFTDFAKRLKDKAVEMSKSG